jgi:hypothetical protein
MRMFDAGAIYPHMRETHGGIYDAENAPVQNVDINEQLEALREAERARRPPGPVPAPFPLGYANLDVQYAQQQARLRELRQRQEELAREEARRRREEGRWCIVM